MIPTTIRVVCANTLSLALGEAGTEGISIRHHSTLDERVKDARQKLSIIIARFDRFDEELHAMLATQPSVKEIDGYFDGLLPVADSDRAQKIRGATLAAFYTNFQNVRNNLRGIGGTMWSAFNSVSDFYEHQKPFRGKGDLARAESRLNSNWFGSANAVKQTAYKLALVMAGVK
jgi:phage/plasmid-like protein (TIGR03299 family)